MKSIKSIFLFLAIAALAIPPAMSVELTIPTVKDTLNPEMAGKFNYIEDSDLGQALNMPVYEWLPVGREPRVVCLGIHGLTLHGRRYRVLARTLASEGVVFAAPDMRGFGRCRFDEEKRYSTKGDDKTKINHEKSYADLVKLAQLLKERYPNIPLIVLGESLGCTFCVRLAGEHPELVTGMILSAPAVKVNPAMYLSPADIGAGMKALVSRHHELNLHHFITSLVSASKEVVDEMLDDPLILKKVPLFDLLATDEFVEKTVKYGKSVPAHMSVLIIQGSSDRCVVPDMVTHLTSAMSSDDQTVRWLGSYGHLQLETSFLRAAVVDSVRDWFEDHSPAARDDKENLGRKIVEAGGVLVQ
jgi:acylglycerol lipase